MFGWVEIFSDVVGEVGEGVERWGQGSGEGSDGGLVGVAGVEEEDLGVGEEGVPVVGVDVLARARWVDRRVAEGDDLALELELEAAEGRIFCGRKLYFGAGEAGALCKEPEEAVDGFGIAGHGAVDAFGGDERGAAQIGGGEGGAKLVAEGCGSVEREEFVEGCDGDHAGFSVASGVASGSPPPPLVAILGPKVLSTGGLGGKVSPRSSPFWAV